MNRLDHGSWTEANAGRWERAHQEPEPVDREWAEDGPKVTPEERAESDRFWGGDAA